MAAVFLVDPSVTVGASGKVLAFIALCILPVLCIGTGTSVQNERSKQTSYCVSCHTMVTHGRSLHLLDRHYIPAQHFQNHLVPSDKACYTCHTNYTMYGPLKDKLRGLTYLYVEYLSTPPKPIHLFGTYPNSECLHCHLGTRDFEDNLGYMPSLAVLKSDKVSCISSGCHDMIHDVSKTDHMKLWTGGPVASDSSSASAANASPAAANAPAGGSGGKTTGSGGKAIFDSHGCKGCHGEAGGGGAGPALTDISSKYPSAKLTALLKAPTSKMKAAGMVPLTLNAADMKELVTYIGSLGGGSAAAASTSSSSGSSSASTAKAKSGAANGAAGGSAGNAADSKGKAIFDSHGCKGCHGEAGGGGAGPALTNISSKYPSAKLTALLKAPTSKMKSAGMVPLTLKAADMKELVKYIGSLGGGSAAAASTSSSSGSSPASTAKAKSGAANGAAGGSAGNAADSKGKAIFDSHGCKGCHGEAGGGGAGPALTNISSKYPSAKLTALLKAPTAKMKSAGMVPLTLKAADMKALVKYLGSLGGKSSASGAGKKPSAAAGSSKLEPKAAYQSFCASCHGDNGTGNGSGAVAFNPRPADFTDCAKMKMRSDEFLYEVVAKGGAAEGLSRTMPGWSEAFTGTQIHGLVGYLRTFCKK
jgi:mono/diheme cytochrome c family protein